MELFGTTAIADDIGDTRLPAVHFGQVRSATVPSTPAAPRSLLDIEALCEFLRRSPSWVYDRLNKRSRRYDPAFPRPVRLGQGARSPNAWFVDEIDAWLNALQRAR